MSVSGLQQRSFSLDARGYIKLHGSQIERIRCPKCARVVALRNEEGVTLSLSHHTLTDPANGVTTYWCPCKEVFSTTIDGKKLLTL